MELLDMKKCNIWNEKFTRNSQYQIAFCKWKKKKSGNLQRAIRGIKIKHRDKRVKAKQKNQNHSKL